MTSNIGKARILVIVMIKSKFYMYINVNRKRGSFMHCPKIRQVLSAPQDTYSLANNYD